MESGEAKATWQRMANRCFLQEEAIRTPKLACSSLSRPRYDTNGEAINGTGQTASNFVPSIGNKVNLGVPPNTKWWLQFELNSTYLTDSSHEQFNAVGEELEDKTGGNVVQSPQRNSDSLPGSKYDFDINRNINSFVQSPQMASTTFMKQDCKTKVEELKAVKSSFPQSFKCKADMDEKWYEKELMDWNTNEKQMSKKLVEDYFELEPEFIGGKEAEPWWQVADKYELALLVSQRSLYQVENCDLPKPQKLCASADSLPCFEKFNQNRTSSENFVQNEYPGICNRTVPVLKTSNSGSMDGQSQPSDKVNLSANLEKCCTNAPAAATNNPQERRDVSVFDHNKAKLLEALCHSQTRARKAEIAAQKAHNEKEHIVKLLFRQASHLFAYKQWLQLLQMESLCLQMKIREHQISTLLPDLPWFSLKWPQMGSARRDDSARKGKKKKKKCSTCRYFFAFAIGFSLASAGLILGMTLGWLPMVL